jgi:hypothetical protein
MFTPFVVNTPVRGMRKTEPSINRRLDVPITCPPVGWPTSLPSPSARNAFGKISASLYDWLLMSSTSGRVHFRSYDRSTSPVPPSRWRKRVCSRAPR